MNRLVTTAPLTLCSLLLLTASACSEPDGVAVREASLSSGDGTLAEIVAADGDFSTLLAAVELAGLTGALSDSEAQLTLLAPSNRAFERTLSELGLQAADLLTEDNRDLLTEILLYHVVPGVAPSSTVRTLGGGRHHPPREHSTIRAPLQPPLEAGRGS